MKFEIFTSVNGASSARILFDDGSTRLMHSAVNPQIDEKLFSSLPQSGETVIALGVALGYQLIPIAKALGKGGTIILVDKFAEAISHTVNATLADCECVVITVLSISDIWNIPIDKRGLVTGSRIFRHPSSINVDPDFYEAISNELFKPSPIKTTHSQKRPALILRGKHFLQNEITSAFSRAIGVQSVSINYDDYPSALEYEAALHQIVAIHNPALIISINMKGIDTQGITVQIASRFGVPLVVWFVDDPRPIVLASKCSPQKFDLALCWERAYLPYLDKCEFKKTAWLPLATDPSIFSDARQSANKYRISFVGSAMSGKYLDDIKAKFLYSPQLQPVIDSAASLLLDGCDSTDMTDVIGKALWLTKSELPFADERNLTWLASCTIHTASAAKRQAVVSSLINHGLTIFGDKEEWRKIFGSKINAQNPLGYGTELAAIYASSSINLNITSSQMPSAVNQRVFDVPIAGGFLLSDDQSDMSELFELDKEAICYDSIESCVDKSEYFVAHESERIAISSSARKRILAHHTYDKRAEAILDILGIQYGDIS